MASPGANEQVDLVTGTDPATGTQETVLNDLVNQIVADRNYPAAAATIARLPPEQQAEIRRRVRSAENRSSGGYNYTEHLDAAVYAERQRAFARGELLPGVDKAGGGTGLTRDQIQSILTGGAMEEAEALQGSQPGIEAYTEGAVLDQGPGYSLLDRLNDTPGAFHDESVDGMNVVDEEALRQTRTDSTGREAQLRSLADYDKVIAEEGLTAIDRARIERMRQDTARRGRAQEAAIMADAAERGRAGGNLSFLMRSQAQQAATNERAMGDMDTAAMGLARKDDAIRNRGFLGGDVQAADDAIDRFNVENSQGVLTRNADRKFKAEAARWDQEQINKGENVDVRQGAVGAEYDNDTARSAANADRTYNANVANDAGVRGRWQDQWGALNNKHSITQTGPAYENVQPTPGTPGSNGLAAAGQGAIGGAAAGSTLGPIGTVGGAAVGGFLGFLGGRQKRQRGTDTSW